MWKLRREDVPEFSPRSGAGAILNVSLMKQEDPRQAEYSREGVRAVGGWETGARSGEHLCVPHAALGTVTRHSSQAVLQVTTLDPRKTKKAS